MYYKLNNIFRSKSVTLLSIRRTSVYRTIKKCTDFCPKTSKRKFRRCRNIGNTVCKQIILWGRNIQLRYSYFQTIRLLDSSYLVGLTQVKNKLVVVTFLLPRGNSKKQNLAYSRGEEGLPFERGVDARGKF